MFGKKKQKEEKVANTTIEDKNHFKIHTMADDLKAITQGGIVDEPQIIAQKGDTIKNIVPPATALNPFTEKSSKNSPDDIAKVPQATQSATNENPFFTDKTNPDAGVILKTDKSVIPKREQKIPEIKISRDVDKKVEAKPQEKAKENTQPNPFIANQTSQINVETQKNQSLVEAKSGVAAQPDKNLSPKITFTEEASQKAKTGIEAEVNALSEKKNESKVDFKDVFAETAKKKENTDDFFGVTQADKEVNPADLVKETAIVKEKNVGGKKVAFVITLIVLTTLLVVAALFGWYWWSNKGAKTAPEEITPQEEQVAQDEVDIEELEPEPEPETKKYAIDFPNYIEIKDSGSALTDLQQKFEEISLNMPAQEIATPISFLVTDVSGSPLSFRSFALLTGMQFSENIYAAAGDAFEIYAVEDRGVVYFGLGFETKDQQAMRSALKGVEPQLPEILAPLYNRVTPTKEEALFEDNIYGDYAVRYANLTEDEGLSIDYTVSDKVYIGTTQNAQRAILDRFAAEEKKVIEKPAQEESLQGVTTDTSDDTSADSDAVNMQDSTEDPDATSSTEGSEASDTVDIL